MILVRVENDMRQYKTYACRTIHDVILLSTIFPENYSISIDGSSKRVLIALISYECEKMKHADGLIFAFRNLLL